MKYSYEFKRNPLGYLRIILPQEINLFSEFIEDIVFETEVDEYIDIVQIVMEGEYDEFEIEGNATSVLIKKDTTVLHHFYIFDKPNENEIETEQFKELMLIWRNKISERYKEPEN
ncbi:tRNA-Val4 [Peribacillus frigoritolerans]|uniref:tRNA-Val4 n=1 Tax=Peribacillus frigoritolerans TaxID=450367 RepID=UPI00257007F3|nr:tRNA-Val4 [Peribacillus frigoritolerans]MDM5308112.1 tRNA-Val4 [Peribacillus frigoritolerans]WJE46693.1 tRNA-Val4 [Peribacillus frigoritolerans]